MLKKCMVVSSANEPKLGLMSTAPAYTDEGAAWPPEPAWSHADVEDLTETEITAILLRRLRNLTARGFDPLDALRLASKLDIPLL